MIAGLLEGAVKDLGLRLQRGPASHFLCLVRGDLSTRMVSTMNPLEENKGIESRRRGDTAPSKPIESCLQTLPAAGLTFGFGTQLGKKTQLKRAKMRWGSLQ